MKWRENQKKIFTQKKFIYLLLYFFQPKKNYFFLIFSPFQPISKLLIFLKKNFFAPPPFKKIWGSNFFLNCLYPVMMSIKFQKPRVYNSGLKWVSKLLGQFDPPPVTSHARWHAVSDRVKSQAICDIFKLLEWAFESGDPFPLLDFMYLIYNPICSDKW